MKENQQLLLGFEPVKSPLREKYPLPPKVHFGTSSWTFQGWRDFVYQENYRNEKDFNRRSLKEYAEHPLFKTVGIDRSFYAPLTAEQWQEYAELLPEKFPCVLKASSKITTAIFPNHPRYGEEKGKKNPHFLSPEEFQTSFIEPLIQGFREHVGAIILPLTPAPGARFDAFEKSLEHFLSSVISPFPIAIELRNINWLRPSYFSLLERYNASHVFNFWSQMPSLSVQMTFPNSLGGTGPVIARILQPPGSDYEVLKKRFAPFDKIVEKQPQMRDEVCQLIRKSEKLGKTSYILVGNKAEGSAPKTIEALIQQFSLDSNPEERYKS